MPPLPLSVDELLTTTRAVRRRLDLSRPVDPELIRECLQLAIQAPTAANRQDWHFVVVTDPEQRAGLAELYHDSWRQYRAGRSAGALSDDEGERAAVMRRVARSAQHLAEHLHEVPVHLIPCIARRPTDSVRSQSSLWGSIVPAAWSFMLAARSRGLGTTWTTLHLRYEREAAQLLDIPHDEVTQAALIPVAHYTGEDFSPAPRQPLDEVVHWDRW
ncbi:MAG TPA: nitroreductase family protein [Nitriliruptorales bacterium]|nr:nitroreductase family protein [Nitriliruptorales bacterium]